MTERLSALLHREADGLDVPPPSAGPVLAQGRTLRRRRRLATLGAAASVLVVVGGLGAVALGGDDPSEPTPARSVDGPVDTGVTFALGATVYYDDATKQATIDDKAVKSLYYTSAGVLVRHGNNSYSDGGGPQRFSLLRPDGTLSPVSVETEETVHATDPAQPYVAYAQDAGGTVEVVVHDVDTDTEVARVPVPGAAASFLPVALSGDHVYLGAEMDDFVIDWRTGEISQPRIVQGFPDVAGGRFTTSEPKQIQVRDAKTGAPLLTVPVSGYVYVTLSPDGRYAALDQDAKSDIDVYDVDAGSHVTIPGGSSYGWTVDDELFRLTRTGLDTCAAATGECSSTALDLPGRVGEAQLGGRTYES
ncbi:MAG: hypothetical protein WC642_03720 [Nocardioides sp.]|jgi:hypothetical protein